MSAEVEFDRVVPDEERFDDNDEDDGTLAIVDNPRQPLGLRILDGVKCIMGTQTGDFDILHADGLVLEARQKTLEKR